MNDDLDSLGGAVMYCAAQSGEAQGAQDPMDSNYVQQISVLKCSNGDVRSTPPWLPQLCLSIVSEPHPGLGSHEAMKQGSKWCTWLGPPASESDSGMQHGVYFRCFVVLCSLFLENFGCKGIHQDIPDVIVGFILVLHTFKH